jgi:hypothetical protein
VLLDKAAVELRELGVELQERWRMLLNLTFGEYLADGLLLWDVDPFIDLLLATCEEIDNTLALILSR